METMQGLPLNVREWLNQRGITNSIISLYHIGWTGEIISIPIVKEGIVLFHKYRRSPFSVEGPKYTYEKGASVQLFGTESLTENTEVFICEGELDALMLISKGLSAVSSTGGAMMFKKEWVSYFDDRRPPYVCFDNDRAGIDGSINIHRIFPEAGIMSLPENIGEHGDVTDFFIKMGKSELDFIQLYCNARKFLPFPEPEDLRKDRKLLETYKKYADELLEEQRTLRMENKDNALLSAFLDEYAKLIAESRKKKKVAIYIGNSDRITTAKQIPITDYMKFDRKGFANCIWHQEKTPSMHYSPKENRVYCFGCSRNGDVIDVIQELHKVDLKGALQIILNEKEEQNV